MNAEHSKGNVLSRIHWQLYGQLDFKEPNVTDGQRLKMWFALVRTLAKRNHAYFPRLLWVLRFEQGKASEMPRLYCLIGGLPQTALDGRGEITLTDEATESPDDIRHLLVNKWGRMGLSPEDKRDRASEWSICDSRLNGESYIRKCLGGEESHVFRHVYETGDFSSLEAHQLTLSDSVIQLVGA